MGYLIASAFFFSAFTLAMRYSVGKGAAPLALNLVVRGTISVCALVFLLIRGDLGPVVSHWKISALLGGVGAVSYWLAGLGALQSVRRGPLGISWTILRCSMIVPVLASIFYWRELALSPVSGLLVMRLFGIVLGLCTVVVCGMGRRGTGPGAPRRRTKRGWAPWMAAAFLAQGTWGICVRATRAFPSDGSRAGFLLFAFAASCVLTAPVLAVTRTPVRWKELKYGLILGVCSLLTTSCRVMALKFVDGTIVFPVTTVTVMLVAQGAGRFLWKERSRYAALGLALGIAAVLLLAIG